MIQKYWVNVHINNIIWKGIKKLKKYIKRSKVLKELKVLREFSYLKLRRIRILENTIGMSLEEYEELGALRFDFFIIDGQIQILEKILDLGSYKDNREL